MIVNPGELDKRIQIVKAAEPDADGYTNDNYELVHKCRAKFTRMSGTETFRSGADFANNKVRFLIRYTKNKITNNMLIIYRDDLYEISYVNNYGDKNTYIEIIAQLRKTEVQA